MVHFAPSLTIDFGTQKAGADWYVINDGVMGGLSKGKITFTDNTFQFNGTVSLANNGGFTSFRSPFQRIDLSGFENVSIRLKTTGQTLAFVLETEQPFYRPYYKQALTTETDDWQTLQFKLTDFEAYQLGRKTGKKLTPALLSEIIRIGFITNDKKECAFTAEIDFIEFK